MRQASLLLLLLLAGCATSFHPRDTMGLGFGDEKVTEDTYFVAFFGNAGTPVERAHDFALLRAAQLGQQHGYRYFVILEDRSNRIAVAPGRQASPGVVPSTESGYTSGSMGGSMMNGSMGGSMGRSMGSSMVGVTNGSPDMSNTYESIAVLKVRYVMNAASAPNITLYDTQSVLGRINAKYSLHATDQDQ